MQQFNSPWMLRMRPNSMATVLFALVLLLVGSSVQAQVATRYNETEAAGTYSPVGVAGTTALFGDAWNDDDATVTIPFTFTFDGVAYTQLTVSTNGFIVFGNTLTPNNQGDAYVSNGDNSGRYLGGGCTDNGVAAFNVSMAEKVYATTTGTRTNGSANITSVGSTTNMRIGMRLTGTGIPAGATIINISGGTVTLSANATSSGSGTTLTPRSGITAVTFGSAPNREFVIQWTRTSREDFTSNDDLSFQVRLAEGNNLAQNQTVKVVHGTCSTTSTGTSDNPQVGIRSTISDINARETTSNWAATTLASANTDVCLFRNTIAPVSGRVYTWTPTYCVSPVTAGSISGTSPICAGTGTTLTLSGQSTTGYGLSTAWFYGTVSGGPYPNAAGSGTSLATGSLTSTRYYVATTTCSTGGNATTSQFAVVVSQTPTTANAGSNQAICAGDTATLAANNPSVGTGAWSIVSVPVGGSSALSQFSNAATNNTTFGPSAAVAGAYTLRWTISNGACTASTSDVVITVNTSPTVPSMTPTSATICAGSSQLLGASSTSNGTVLSSPFASTGGPATVSASGANSANIYPWNITVSGLPTSGVTIASVTINGINHTYPADIDLLLQSNGGTNVILMSDVGSTATGTANDAVNLNYTFQDGATDMTANATNASGTYSPTNGNTGSDDWPSPGPGTLTQLAPALSTISGDVNGVWKLFFRDDANVDAGSIASWSITFNVPATVSYLWAPNVNLSGTSGPSVTASPTSTQAYMVTVSHNANSCTTIGNVTVNVNAKPTASVSGGGAVCAGAALPDVTFTFTGAAPYNFTYDPGAVAVTGHMTSTYTITGAAAGTYSVTALTDANCTGTSLGGNVSVVVNPLPTASVSGGGAICTGSTLPNVTFTFTGGGPYNFTYTDGTTSFPIVGASSPYVITAAAVGTYSVTALSNANCTGTSFGGSVSVTQIPLPTASVSGGGTVCVGDPLPNVVFTFTGAAPYNFTYDPGAVVVTGHMTSTYTITGAAAGTYSVTALTDANCTATSLGGSVSVVVNPLPTASVSGGGPVCSNQPLPDVTFTFTGTAPFDFTYDPGAVVVTGHMTNTYTITGAAVGNYSVTSLTDVNCTGTSLGGSVSLTIVTAPYAGISNTLTVCSNSSAANIFTLLGGADTGGSWSGPSTVVGDLYDPNTMDAGVYTYTVTGTSPCGDAMATITVTENQAPNAGADGTLPVCENDPPADLYGQLGGADLGGTWSGPSPVVGSSFDPSTMSLGVYMYVVPGTAPCANDTSYVTVSQIIATAWYVDTDGDGYGDLGSTPVMTCTAPGGYVDNDADECNTDPDKVEPGNCGCNVVDTDTDGDSFPDCMDLCPNDPLKYEPGSCGCDVVDDDSDGDGAADCVDLCPFDAAKTAPGNCGCGMPETGTACDDGIPTTGDDVITVDCVCEGQLIDCAGVPGGSSLPGTPCDDSDGGTINDTWDASCNCVGTPSGCTQNDMVLDLQTDPNGSQTSWEIIPQAGGSPLCSGSGYANNTLVSISCCLADGCYDLRVMDSFGDGMTTGGYMLRYASGERIIDNDGTFTYLSTIASNQGFCLPIGPDHLTSATCDLTGVPYAGYVQAQPNQNVSAQYGITNSTSGYGFWFFNPDGGYTRQIFISHAFNNYWFPAGAARASYLKFTTVTTNPLPQNVLLNVRVRSRVAGVYSPFGSTCRLMIGCATTQLVSTPGPQLSCGITNVPLNGSKYLFVNPIGGAVKYQFEFTKPGYTRYIAVASTSLQLKIWGTLPLQYGFTYNVRVAVSYDGTTYCPFGPSCTITTANSGNFNSLEQEGTASLHMWPNPNRGDQLYLALEEVPSDVMSVGVEVHDLFGKRVTSRTINTDGAGFSTVIELHNELASGVYTVNVIVGDHVMTQRLVIE